jgi:hypothetical protein
MHKVSVSINNDLSLSKTMTIIEEVNESFEGENLSSVIGKAMRFVNTVVNRQYDAPSIVIAGVELPTSMGKKFAVNHYDFDISFEIIREHILGELARVNEEAGVEYIRRTDINGVFKSKSNFTAQQVSAQIKERTRMVKEIVRWTLEDAKDSVVPDSVKERRAQLAEQAKAKRIAAKTQALLA